ncbi:MAG: hypothetical protein OEM41_10030, partial [Ignavibacteria bacterium]|nr:hypothetical protein [Ignavibacteria bacterium]
ELGHVSVECRIGRSGREATVEVAAPDRDRSAVTIVSLDHLKRRGYRREDGNPLPDTLLCPRGETTRIACRIFTQ